jgi:hypothetical protein
MGREFNGNQYSSMDNILYTSGQLVKQMLFMNTSFDGRMNELDAANMRANMKELQFLISTILMIFLIGMAFDDDDKYKFMANAMINVIGRQQSDILMFSNPLEAESLSKNIIPLTGVLHDFNKVIWSVKEQMSGEGDYDRGVYKGDDKTAVAVSKLIPALNQGFRLIQYGSQELDK